MDSSENKALLVQELDDMKYALDEASIVAITDEVGVITYVNETFCKISKYSEPELIGRNHRILKSGYHTREFYHEMWNVISQGKVWKGELKNRAKDGTHYWVNTVIVPFVGPSGKPEKYISIRTDITKQKEIQEQMLKMERLSAIGEISARIAHDMRNPLSVLKNSIDLMKMRKTELDEKTLKNLTMADRAILRIVHQIDEVLDYVSPKPLNLESISLSKILTSTLERMSVSEKVIINLPENDAVLYCDPIKIEILFVNLISNAIQAMDNSGKIDIRVKDENEQTLIEVKDYGIGIPEHLLNKIFDPLFTTKQIGTGLGLTSCKNIVEAHGGMIIAKNNPTTFVITIPRRVKYEKCNSN